MGNDRIVFVDGVNNVIDIGACESYNSYVYGVGQQGAPRDTGTAHVRTVGPV